MIKFIVNICPSYKQKLQFFLILGVSQCFRKPKVIYYGAKSKAFKGRFGRVILELSAAENLNQTWVFQEVSFMRKLEENWPPIYDPDFFLCFPMFSSSILLKLNLELSSVRKFEENNPFMFIPCIRIHYMIFGFSHASLSVTASRLCYNGYFVRSGASSPQSVFLMSNPAEYRMIMQQRTPNQRPR